jgi:hypothetical protein
MRKREIMNDIKQYELSYDQIDQIVIEELKEVVDLNWNGDHQLIEAAFTLLAYFMPKEDYLEYKSLIEQTPPRDSNYDNNN